MMRLMQVSRVLKASGMDCLCQPFVTSKSFPLIFGHCDISHAELVKNIFIFIHAVQSLCDDVCLGFG